jgi:hypothetical protein
MSENQNEIVKFIELPTSKLEWIFGAKSAVEKSARITNMRVQNHMIQVVSQHFK